MAVSMTPFRLSMLSADSGVTDPPSPDLTPEQLRIALDGVLGQFQAEVRRRIKAERDRDRAQQAAERLLGHFVPCGAGWQRSLAVSDDEISRIRMLIDL